MAQLWLNLPPKINFCKSIGKVTLPNFWLNWLVKANVCKPLEEDTMKFGRTGLASHSEGSQYPSYGQSGLPRASPASQSGASHCPNSGWNGLSRPISASQSGSTHVISSFANSAPSRGLRIGKSRRPRQAYRLALCLFGGATAKGVV